MARWNAGSILLQGAQATTINNALNALRAHYASARTAWGALTPEQRAALLAQSPVLAAILAFARDFPD